MASNTKIPLLATAVLTTTIWACWYILGWRKMALLNGTRGDNIQQNWLSTVMFIRICGHHQMHEIRTHLHIAFEIWQIFLEQRNVMCKRVLISYTWGWLHSIRSLSQQINIVVARQHSCMSSPLDQFKKRRFLAQIPVLCDNCFKHILSTLHIFLCTYHHNWVRCLSLSLAGSRKNDCLGILVFFLCRY